MYNWVTLLYSGDWHIVNQLYFNLRNVFNTPNLPNILGFPGSASDKEPAYQCRRHKRCRFNPWVRKKPWRREWQPAPVFLPGEFHGQRSLAGYSPQGHKELDTTEWLTHTHYKVDFKRKYNTAKRPPWLLVKDRDAWHSPAHGVEKSQTQLINWMTAILKSVALKGIQLSPVN